MVLKQGDFLTKFGVLSICHIAFKTKVHMFGLSSTSIWVKILTEFLNSFLNDHMMKMKSQIMKNNKFPEARNKVNKGQHSALYKK